VFNIFFHLSLNFPFSLGSFIQHLLLLILCFFHVTICIWFGFVLKWFHVLYFEDDWPIFWINKCQVWINFNLVLLIFIICLASLNVILVFGQVPCKRCSKSLPNEYHICALDKIIQFVMFFPTQCLKPYVVKISLFKLFLLDLRCIKVLLGFIK